MKQDVFTKLQRYGLDGCNSFDLLLGIVGESEITNYNIKDIHDMSLEELLQIKGIGKNAATAIKCAFELGKRYAQEKASEDNERLDYTERLYDYLSPHFHGEDKELFYLVVMNNNLKPIKLKRLSIGGLTECMADIRLIMREVLLSKGTVLAVAHNHPSGNAYPSKMDDRLTEDIRKSCETMRIHFLDHLVITDKSYYSYHDHGRI